MKMPNLNLAFLMAAIAGLGWSRTPLLASHQLSGSVGCRAKNPHNHADRAHRTNRRNRKRRHA
jgi:hypothetical protein